MEFLNDFFAPIIVGICLCVGYIVKNAVPTEKINRFIPLIVAALGVFLNVWFEDWDITPEILLTGLFSGLSSTGLYEAFANFLKREK